LWGGPDGKGVGKNLASHKCLQREKRGGKIFKLYENTRLWRDEGRKGSTEFWEGNPMRNCKRRKKETRRSKKEIKKRGSTTTLIQKGKRRPVNEEGTKPRPRKRRRFVKYVLLMGGEKRRTSIHQTQEGEKGTGQSGCDIQGG